MESPPLSFDGSPGMSRRSSVDDLESFLKSYVPLESLPTPPTLLDTDSGQGILEDACEAYHQVEFTGPALRLANLVPSNASLHRTSSQIIHNYLAISSLPIETLGLAACILDALSGRFATSWRRACLALQNSEFSSGMMKPRLLSCSTSSILGSEIIVLGALAIASGFVNDRAKSAGYWTETVANGAVSIKQFNTTTRCILADIDFALHSFTAEMIQEAVCGLVRANMGHNEDAIDLSDDEAEKEMSPANPTGAAALRYGVVTPQPSP